MGRLVVVSNRVAGVDASGAASKGGLAMALSAALRDHGGVWFGWNGESSAAPAGSADVQRLDDVDIATIDLDEAHVEEYYNGFANRTLWPLCHYRVDLAAYERSFGAAYLRVNARFADLLLPLLRPDDTIWIHDYHLIPLASELRARGVRNRIGFFLHIPWPAREIIATLPRHHELVQSMFDYDLIGFQTQACLEAFHGYVTGELNGRVASNGLAGASPITALGRTILAGAYPIGIDMDEMRRLVASAPAQKAFAAMRQSAGGQAMMIGVDRIDYSKGLPEKFAGYGAFLRDNPDWRERLFLLQIGQPSRTEVEAYRDLYDLLEAEAGAINGTYGTLDWSPLRYRTQSMPRDVLAGAYRAARAALVTPLRDGMNLVAKEYVAAQDPDDPGVLVLSRFAGAAAQMREALLVNPYSREDLADAIRRAVEMPKPERIARWKSLCTGVTRQDLTAWRTTFLDDLMPPAAGTTRGAAAPRYGPAAS